jgi:D-beta-D-heptose 7-phosphate kinase / D-beta-D-heptose 1-phosphate adenosyltransferase
MSQLAQLLQEFRGKRITVIGEAILDSYLHGRADRLCREAPVPIVALDDRIDAPGGAANTAVNVARLGGDVRLLSAVGRDGEAERLRAGLRAVGVDDREVVDVAGRATLAKQRLYAGGQMVVRFDTGSTDPIGVATEERLIDRLEAVHAESDALIVSDYGYGIMTDRIVNVLSELQARDPRVLVVDARDLRRYRRAGATAVKPNYGEAVRLLGEREKADPRERARQVGSEGPRLLELTGARIAAVTVDTAGAFIFEADAPAYRTYARPQSESRAAGAGDTFVATLALALAARIAAPQAAELASAAAGVVVGKDGTSSCSFDELEASLSTAAGKRLDSLERLRVRIAYHREQGRRIVFTNGCFDILHRGHITYLSRAKALGDVLVVGVNADASVGRLKGPGRPINGLDDRLEVLEALSCIDLVVPFEEDTPDRLVRVIRPDVFVKGGDYTRESLPEAPLVESLGGTVQILPYIEDRSTTGVIERVRERDGQASERRAAGRRSAARRSGERARSR